MIKQDLYNLTDEVRKITNRIPAIIGSQAVFAVTDFPPEVVHRSVECDFLLLNEDFAFVGRLKDFAFKIKKEK